jgi:SAM-dependent methyltransferase
MVKPTYLAERCVEGQRLTYYLSAADAAFWEQHWQQHFSPAIYRSAEQGVLWEFEEPFTRYLPRQGRILEAGCGLGQLVLALRARGYDVEGAEWAEDTVRQVRTLRPDIPIRVGDVTCLDVPDGHYAGYISIGVVEHRKEGPEPFLREAWRILQPGGVALISVPWFNPLRRRKAQLGFYRGITTELEFYQYAFTGEEFTQIVSCWGFELVDSMSYQTLKGLKDEVPLLRRMLRWRFVGWRLNRWLKAFPSRYPEFAQRVGHMLLIVGRKPW